MNGAPRRFARWCGDCKRRLPSGMTNIRSCSGPTDERSRSDRQTKMKATLHQLSAALVAVLFYALEEVQFAVGGEEAGFYGVGGQFA